MSHIKTQQLRYFVAVFNMGSITAAAQQVHATQSGVSMQIREFEERLGLPLFERTPTGVKPTKAGEIVYRRATRILRELDELENDVIAQRGHLYGHVRAGIMPTFARSVLAPTLIEYSGQHPFVDVQISEGYSERLTKRVANGELDFAIVPAGPLPAGLRSSHVGSDLELLVESAGDADGGCAATRLSTAQPLKLLLPSSANARRKGIDQYLDNVCQSRHTFIELDSMMTTFDLLTSGNYASILPGCLCVAEFHERRLKLSPILDPALTVDYLLIEPAAKATSAVVGAFEEVLCRLIGENCEFVRKQFSELGTADVEKEGISFPDLAHKHS